MFQAKTSFYRISSKRLTIKFRAQDFHEVISDASNLIFFSTIRDQTLKYPTKSYIFKQFLKKISGKMIVSLFAIYRRIDTGVA